MASLAKVYSVQIDWNGEKKTVRILGVNEGDALHSLRLAMGCEYDVLSIKEATK